MNRLYVRINDIWRRLFGLPPSQEMIELNLEDLMEAEKRTADNNLEPRLVQQYCCTMFWDINDPERKGDKSVTVTSQKMCDEMVKKNRAKGSRPLLKGAC